MNFPDTTRLELENQRAVSYDERFTGMGAAVIAIAWVAMGAGWCATGAMLWLRFAAEDHGRVVAQWQKRLLLAAAVTVLLAGTTLLVPALLGIEGSGSTP